VVMRDEFSVATGSRILTAVSNDEHVHGGELVMAASRELSMRLCFSVRSSSSARCHLLSLRAASSPWCKSG
jgi:hypothetical protein